MKTTSITAENEALFRTEAQRRADIERIKIERQTNKQLAELTGFSPLYVAQIVSRYRREIELRCST